MSSNPGNEVWGKVMFLLTCVILFLGGRGSLYDVTSCLADWSHVPYRGFSVQWGSLSGRSPLYGDDRAVRILLEYFFVLHKKINFHFRDGYGKMNTSDLSQLLTTRCPTILKKKLNRLQPRFKKF